MRVMEKSVHTPEYLRLLGLLQAARRGAGLSQRDLAARLAVTHTWVCKAECGERRLDVLEFSRFLLACDVDPAVAFERWVRDVLASKPSNGQMHKGASRAGRIRGRHR
jgi:transcriptional regulator with XRE-family HTH domain